MWIKKMQICAFYQAKPQKVAEFCDASKYFNLVTRINCIITFKQSMQEEYGNLYLIEPHDQEKDY